MALTKDRLAAVVVTIANGILGASLGHFSQSYATEAGFALLLSIPGLVVISFRETLGRSIFAFPRGVPRESPPILLALVGWIYLLVIPALYVYELSKH